MQRTVCLAVTTQALPFLLLGTALSGIPALAADTWVTITGSWHAGGTLGTSSARAALDDVTVEKVAKPVNPYQDAPPFPASR